jgi:hypothetical protein
MSAKNAQNVLLYFIRQSASRVGRLRSFPTDSTLQFRGERNVSLVNIVPIAHALGATQANC